MSGGHFDYIDNRIAETVFGYSDLYPDYGEEGFGQAKKAAKINPFDDVEISEMFWDMLCLLHSLDWCQSGDTSEATYRQDVEYFKEKWFGKTEEERAKRIIDNALECARGDIMTALGISDTNGNED